MRKMSEERRKVVVLASSLACMAGVGPVLLRQHPRLEWAWLVVYVSVLVWVIVRMARLKRDEGCK